MTAPEITLWNLLRQRPEGFKFRRQHPLGPYILDFYCASTGLAIEVDRIAHDMGQNPARDEVRDRWLAARHVKALRFPAADVQNDLDAVGRLILSECEARRPSTPTRFPSPAKAGEE
ncbi:endonuclease domain-containing protein [Sphingomonas sp.]|uniref:endonuclease domain-containing protein n=1 Tax=Sphingomonas sp. TaxID=28214 RepID=UPI003FA6D11D